MVEVVRPLTLCLEVVAFMVAAPVSTRAQALPGLELHWQGPPSCAEPTDVHQAARSLLRDESVPRATLSVRVELQALADGSFSLVFEAQGQDGRVQRTLTLASCEDARQAAALLIALTLDPEASPPTPRLDAPAPDPAPPAPDPAPPAPGPAPSKTPAPSEATPVRTPEPQPLQAAAGARPPGATLGLAGGLELSAPSSPAGVFSARLGFRWRELQLEAAGRVWLPTRGQIDGVELAVDMLGGAASACYGLAFGPWELGPCLGLELTRVRAELDGMDAGTATWARASLGPRLGWWVSEHVALDVAADALLALHRPRFSTDAGQSARTPAVGVVSRVGVAYAFGAHGRAP